MIAFLSGQVHSIDTNSAIVLTQGVGYQVLLSKTDLDNLSLNQTNNFYIYSNIREDAFDLYGFLHPEHKQIFQLLISVSGIGPKLGLTIISALSPADLISALINKDLALLSSISGIGKKTAERLALELSDKAQKLNLPISLTAAKFISSNQTELQQAIRGLGYTREQSELAIAKIRPEDLQSWPLENLIKQSLKFLTGAKTS